MISRCRAEFICCLLSVSLQSRRDCYTKEYYHSKVVGISEKAITFRTVEVRTLPVNDEVQGIVTKPPAHADAVRSVRLEVIKVLNVH